MACVALIKAPASTGEADKAEAVVPWMRSQGMAPDVRRGAEFVVPQWSGQGSGAFSKSGCAWRGASSLTW